MSEEEKCFSNTNNKSCALVGRLETRVRREGEFEMSMEREKEKQKPVFQEKKKTETCFCCNINKKIGNQNSIASLFCTRLHSVISIEQSTSSFCTDTTFFSAILNMDGSRASVVTTDTP